MLNILGKKSLYPYLGRLETFVFNNKKTMQALKKSLEDTDFIVGVSRGGLIPAAMFATKFDIPLVSCYVNKTKNYEISCDHLDWLKNKKICIVDDVLRSGKTMKDVVDFFKHKKSLKLKDIQVLVLFREKRDYDFEQHLVTAPLIPYQVEQGTKVIFSWDTQTR